jgi:soluble lytic murein transglycosylase-like protein
VQPLPRALPVSLLAFIACGLGFAAAPAVSRAGVAVPSAVQHSRATVAKAAKAQPPARRHHVAVALPVSSPWALPPMMLLHARWAPARTQHALALRVLRFQRIALSPSARRHVAEGSVSAGALRLLLNTPRTGSPMLVFEAAGSDVRAQEIALWMTRRAVRGFTALPHAARPARLLLEPVPADRADLAGPPRPRAGDLRTLASLYRSAGYEYGLDWRVLAAINLVETNLGRNTHVSSAGAVGWMQFMPSTWRRWGVDADGDGVADPYDPTDAVYSAARYLAAAGGSADIRRAIFAYNHAAWYVNEVLRIAASLPNDYGQR